MISFLKVLHRSSRRIAVALCSALVLVVVMGTGCFSLGYEVYYKGESLGVVSVTGPVIAQASELDESSYYLKIVSPTELTDENKIMEQLVLANGEGVEACVLYLSGEAVFAVESQEILERILNDYQAQYGETQISIFSKDVFWETKLVTPDSVRTEKEANEILRSKDENGNPLLSVLCAEESSWEESLPYETIYENTDELTQGHTMVKTAGKEGKVLHQGYQLFANGTVVQKCSFSEQIVEEPTPAVVLVGTREPGNGEGTGSYVRPCAGAFSSGYGSRWGRNHNGVDMRASAGTSIVAADSGTVVFSGWNNGGFGYLVKIDHGDGIETWYAHCSELLVEEGDIVSKGELIARVGSTGRSTGNHLHFELHMNGSPINPANYINF